MPHVQSSIDGQVQRMPHSMSSLARSSSATRASISASFVPARALVVPLIKIPGVTNVHVGLSLREKLRRARDRNLWPDSAIVRIDFG
jgi:hypothetical protein